MRPALLFWTLLLLTATGLLAQRGPEAGTVALRGVLVAASATPGPTDERLRPYEATLRRILRFESFRYLGAGATTVGTPAQGTVLLGQGHRLDLTTEAAGNGGYRVQLHWLDRGQSLMRTGLILRPGVPAVLGGPARGDGEVYAVIVIAE